MKKCPCGGPISRDIANVLLVGLAGWRITQGDIAGFLLAFAVAAIMLEVRFLLVEVGEGDD